MKRIISLLLVLALLTGNLAPAAAVEVEGTTAPTVETAMETTEAVLPTEEETEPTETTMATEPETLETTAPTEPEQVELEETAEAKGATIVDSGTCGENVTWALDSEGTLTISGEGAMEDYGFEDTAPWYDSRESIQTITIEAGVTTIGDCAFQHCDYLTNVTIPAGVTTIGNYAFRGCSENLANVTIPDSVTYIGWDAFCACYSLTSVNIPKGVTAIEDGTFSFCRSLTSVTIPDSVTYIGWDAFYECDSLKTVTIPDSVDWIGGAAFSSSGLTSVIIPDGVTSIGGNTFLYCNNLTSVTIPDSVTIIEWSAFDGCSSLASITIPDRVTTIGDYAFRDCTSLTSVKIPNGVTAIGEDTFGWCSNLISVTIPDSVTSIGKQAFRYCSSLTNVTIPSSVTVIGSEAFSHCFSLTSAIIPDGVTTIGDSAFFDCESLTSVKIPASVISIGEEAFCSCGSLTSIYVAEGNPCYASDSAGGLFDKEMTKLMCFPGSYEGEYTIPDSVTAIGVSAFDNCFLLTSVTIPDSVTVIGESAFPYCFQLNEIYFEGNAPSFGGNVFNQVTATAYYPEGDATWTEEVRQDYGGTITWVPYTPGEVPGGDTEDKPCTLEELTEADFLAFSAIAYLDFTEGKTIQENLTEAGYWDDIWSKDQNISYAELCKNIANWEVLYIQEDYANLFYAVAFHNANGEAVIAYRGSKPLNSALDLITDWDTFYDWVLNDLPMILFNTETFGSQYSNSLSTYNAVASKSGISKIAVTGHSLGGLWGDVAAAYSGCEGITFNAISALDMIHYNHPKDMGRVFSGVDVWSFTDRVNKFDVLAGMTEHYMPEYIGSLVKPYIAYKSNFGALSIGGNHGLESLVTKNSSGDVILNAEDHSWCSETGVSNYLSFTTHSVDLGFSGRDEFSKGLSVAVARSSYGGAGNDEIITSVWGDTLIGGSGNDTLDGSMGNDTYLYYKGNGCDTINDLMGLDKLYLYGFSESDHIEVFEEDEDSAYIEILCNGESIIKINKNNRAYAYISISSFKIYVDRGGETLDEYNITEYFSTKRYGAHLLIGCPVNVQVLDADGNVVFTLEDGVVGTHYTDYGNFYIFEEEDGGYGKVLDLVEGYSVQIVGVDSGTMDITYQSVVDGELSEAQIITEVPVSDSFLGKLEEDENGMAQLLIDGDLNGDYQVNEADVTHLVWNLLFAETFPLTNDADFDCDGDVDLNDAADLLWRVLFPVTQ